MPIFEIVNGWAITIYLNDHLPIHFHAKKAGMSVRFYLDGTLRWKLMETSQPTGSVW